MFLPVRWEGTDIQERTCVPSGCWSVYHDAVGGSGPGTTPATVSYAWLASHWLGDGTVAGYETAALATTGKAVNTVECYVAELAPGNAGQEFTASISIMDGKTVVSSDPRDESTRNYTMRGKKDLAGGSEIWIDMTDNPAPETDGYRSSSAWTCRCANEETARRKPYSSLAGKSCPSCKSCRKTLCVSFSPRETLIPDGGDAVAASAEREIADNVLPIWQNGVRARLGDMLRWGMYPEVWLAKGERAKREALRELVEGYLFKDVIAFESLRNSDKIRRLLMLVAFQIGKKVSLSELAANLGIARQTVERYLDLLEKTFVIYRVNGFSRNLRSEVVKMSRWYFNDNGVLNAVTGVLLAPEDRPDAGALWENWALAERRKLLAWTGSGTRRWFWRTYSQAEIDSVEEEDGHLRAWEFKWGRKTPRPPLSWREAYPDASFGVVSPETMIPFVCGNDP